MPDSTAAKIKKGIIKVSGNALGAAMSVPHKIRGTHADIKRGHALYKQGFGAKYDSALKIAKAGIKNPRRH
jgi:hypothetical protein